MRRSSSRTGPIPSGVLAARSLRTAVFAFDKPAPLDNRSQGVQQGFGIVDPGYRNFTLPGMVDAALGDNCSGADEASRQSAPVRCRARCSSRQPRSRHYVLQGGSNGKAGRARRPVLIEFGGIPQPMRPERPHACSPDRFPDIRETRLVAVKSSVARLAKLFPGTPLRRSFRSFRVP